MLMAGVLIWLVIVKERRASYRAHEAGSKAVAWDRAPRPSGAGKKLKIMLALLRKCGIFHWLLLHVSP
jgi:hypothetical protein